MADGRARRLSVRIREIVAAALERQVKDPRLGMVTVTDVRMTGDLREATVFYTVYGDEADRAASATALASATGMLRTGVGRQLGLRHTPSLTFVLDAVPEGARHIDELLAQAHAADAEVHRLAAHARPAGGADPYRHRSEDERPSGEVGSDRLPRETEDDR
jgi:ribosome-binding factor A